MMKRYLTPLLFVLGIQASKAQTDTSRSTTDIAHKNLQLPTEISVVSDAKPQFTIDSIAANMNVKKLVGLMQPQTALLAAGTIDAGRTAATLDVSASGGATFSVPFSLPPGLGSVVPQLALIYNSQAGYGTAGYGWNISGLSAICLIPATVFHDGQISGVNFDEHDRFALDGQRLILKSGTYGADGAEYQTESYSNTKIISRGVSPYGQSYGPEYFEVYYSDGSKAYYGLTTNSRTPSDYAVTYTENPMGARINYNYISSGNSLNISQITYGSLGTVPGINQINFSYTIANRAEVFYTGGLVFNRNQLLDKISMVANGTNFRHYALTFNAMPVLDYQRLESIQELDGAENKAFDPIYFTYGTTGTVITTSVISNLSLSNIASNNSQIITSDFTGNGSMDFLLYPNSKDKFWAFYDLDPSSPYMQLGYQVNTGLFKEIFPATWLTHNSKILAGQGMIVLKDGPNNSYKFEMLSSGTVTPVYYQYDRIWDNTPRAPYYYSEFDFQYHQGLPLNLNFLSGDFNGDGLTDMIAISNAMTITRELQEWDYGAGQYVPYYLYEDIGSKAYYIDMDRRKTSDYVVNLGYLSQSFNETDKLYTSDFNGDGKTDILHLKDGVMSVYTMNSNNELVLLWQTSDSRISKSQLILLGDYNGDGKTDVMFSTGYNSFFATFMSTGKSFDKREKYESFQNKASVFTPNPWGGGTLLTYYLIPNDIDGDGKTDMIWTRVDTHSDNSTATVNISTHYNQFSLSTVIPNFGQAISLFAYPNLRHNFIPIFMNPSNPNHKLEFGFLSNNSISLFKFSKDFRKESQMTGVSQDGVSHQIEYQPLVPGQNNGSVPLYQTSYDQTYPYIDLQEAPSMNVVSKLTRSFGSEQIKQVFGYGRAVSHVEGLGYLGFSESIRSNWHTDDSDVNRLFTISINSPVLRGAALKTFTTKSPYLSTTIKNVAPLPADTTLAALLPNAQTVVATNSITLLPGFEAKGINGNFIAKISSPAEGINDGATISDYISRADYAYNTQLLPNKVYVNVHKSIATKDLLNQTNSLQLTDYDAYFNVTKSVSNFGGEGSKTVEVTYGNNSGNNYYIGRLLGTKTILRNGSDAFTSSEEYDYTGYLATQIKKKGNNTPYIIENHVYDNYGNITQKTSIAPGAGQRTVSMVYDASGRFMIQATDAEGMTSSFTYDTSTGTMQSRTNPFDQTDTFLYDTWGRQVRTTDFLNVKSNRNYQKDLNNIIITDIDDEGHSSIQVINALGQVIESKEKTISGQYVGQGWRFDVYGRLVEESQAGQPGNYNQWDHTSYDEYGRVKQITSFTGKITNFSYNGLNTTVNDGVKSITTTKNQFGQIVNLQDQGGTITYNYFANGGLKNTNYSGISLIVEQDGWGQKTKLTDPSSGIYQYEYDGFGQLIKEVTPKGNTEYTYDVIGKLQNKKITGDETNLQYTYLYDGSTKLVTSMNLTNADGNNSIYSYAYDAHKRLSALTENNLHAEFVKSYTYDAYGRISTESYQAKNKLNNIVTQKGIEMHYQNGELLQTTLQGSGQVLWKVNSIDAGGRLRTALQGGALKTTFNYDSYGLPQQRTLDRISGSAANLMNLGYNFDSQRGVLNSRSNSAFNWAETFSYDNLDRLTNFNDNNGNNSQAYDDRGRITSNALGSYSYQSNSYRQNELALTSAGDAYYQARALQQISYNAFKSPVEIIEQGHERISFQYNAALGRSHMYYGGEESDKMQRRYRRHYAEDGSVEITNDFQNGTTSFIFYLGGDGYSAPAIWKEVHGATVTQNLYYLHRDHLGSIVMITDDQGTVVEKRQFDAWGNVVQLTDGNGNPLTAFLIIDRGYTGHEHLLGVGLIHMNGRLYDPKLHRFLSPDNFVQDPYNTQNFNRFGYVMNNPLMFTDASGEFFWLAIAAGAIIGAITGGVSYVATAIKTGTWNWGALGMSMLSGAVVGGITGGVNPTSLLNFSLGKAMTTAFVGGLLPSVGGSIGNFNFSISPSIAFGKSFGVGANLSVGYAAGAWNISAGVGVMYYGNYQGLGKSGTEIRQSLMGGYDDGTTGVTVGTNIWTGMGGMKDFNQRTGVIGVRADKNIRIMYENDGGKGVNELRLGDQGDSYRTAALSLSYKDYSVSFNLMTGNRSLKNQNEEKKTMLKDEKGNLYNALTPGLVDAFGRKFKRGFVNETETPYRVGALSFGYRNYRFGVDSEHVRHAIQNRFIHGFIGDRGFHNMSWDWKGYSQYRTRNIFSSW